MSKKRFAWITPTCILIIIASLIALLYFFTQEKISTYGNWTQSENAESLICKSGVTDYPFFNYDNATKKSMNISIKLENDKLDAISITHVIYYDNKDSVNRSESINHATMNFSFQKDNLTSDAFNANYIIINNNLQVSLYATAEEINRTSAKYFMLDELSEDSYSESSLIRIYSNKGLNCTSKK